MQICPIWQHWLGLETSYIYEILTVNTRFDKFLQDKSKKSRMLEEVYEGARIVSGRVQEDSDSVTIVQICEQLCQYNQFITVIHTLFYNMDLCMLLVCLTLTLYDF